MRRLVPLILLATLPLPAQAPPDPCGPGVIPITWTDANGRSATSPAAFTDLGATALGVPEVAQLFVMTNPGFGTARWYGGATVRDAVNNDWDVVTFTWGGPGTKPLLNNHADLINGPGDEFRISQRRDGLSAVCDTGPSHTVGLGNAVIASRTTVNGQFVDPTTNPPGRIVPITGADLGYIDPHLGMINASEVLFWTDPQGNIKVGDIDTNPYFAGSFPNSQFGVVTNARIAVPVDTVRYPRMTRWHSATPIIDDRPGVVDETRALIVANSVPSGGADSYFTSAADMSRYSRADVWPDLLRDDGSDVNTSPACFAGTSIWADAPGATFGDPLRVDQFVISSVVVPAAGGTARNCVFVPLGTPSDLTVTINYGLPFGPVDPRLLFPAIKFPGIAGLCVSTIASTPMIAPQNHQFCFDLPLPALRVGATLAVQCIGFSQSTAQVWIGNQAWIEIVP
jgi:hypothetical protein